MTDIVVTGAAGFIGMHAVHAFLAQGHKVLGIDNLNDYYSVQLKQDRVARLTAVPGFTFRQIDLVDADALLRLFQQEKPRRILHLAAQPGIRYSLERPAAYVQSNLVATAALLEACRAVKAEHLVFASSSSVYGDAARLPFAEADPGSHPISLYAATKRSGELMAHTYAHLFGMPITALRLFTVYGPWGRPDMAYFKFTKSIIEGAPIDVYAGGRLRRDFTYIDDVVGAMVQVMSRPPSANPGWDAALADAASSAAPFRIYNVGNHRAETLQRFLEVLEEAIGKRAVRRELPAQPGDVVATYADIAAIQRDFGFAPKTSIEVGLPKFVAWYREYFGA